MTTPVRNVAIDLLGRFGVAIDGQPVPPAGWRRRQAASLVKILALAPRHELHREQLIDLMWPELTVGEAAPRLHKAAHFARRACGAEDAVAMRGDLAVLFDGSLLTVDALEFEAVAVSALSARDPVAAAAAADRYVGDLLPEDLYVDWADTARERLRFLHLDVLRAAERWEVLVAADPTDEAAHLALARRFAEHGDTGSALRQLERCARAMDEYVGAPLGAEAAALRDRLLEAARDAARLVPSSSPTGSTAPTGPSSAGIGRSPDDTVQSVLSAAWSRELTGRAPEMERIGEAWQRAKTGLPTYVMIGGEPGVGKTSLVSHAAAACRQDGARVLFGRSDVGVDIPYQPFSEAIRHWMRGQSGAVDAGRTALLARVAPMVHGSSADDDSRRTGSDRDRQELLDSLHAWCEVVVAERPAILILDDLHWADDASVLVLNHLIRHPPLGALLVLGTYRPGELSPGDPMHDLLADVRGDDAVVRIALDGLDVDAVRSMVASSTGSRLPVDGDDFARSLHERTGGNPLFVSMTVRHLLDNGVIEPTAGRWRLDESLAGLSVAAGVSEVVERRMARLDGATGERVRIAAVLGDSFDLGTLTAVTGVDEDDLICSLSEAARAGLLDEVADEVDRYRFTHALVRDALEASVARSRRLRIHWTAGSTLEQRVPVERHLDEAVHHLVIGAPTGDRRHVAAACIRAGEAGLRRAAFERARDHFSEALSQLADIDDADLEWQALHGRGEACGALLARDELLRDHRLAASIALAHRWPERFARSALGIAYFQLPGTNDRWSLQLLDEALGGLPPDADAVRCELLSAHAIQCVAMGDPPAARVSADEALVVARRLDDASLTGTALSARCYTLLGSPAIEELRRTSLEAIARPLPPEGRFIPPHYALGVVSMQRGDRLDFDRAIEDVRRTAERLRSISLAIFVPSWQGAVALAAGDFDASQQHALAARDMSEAPAWHHAYAAHVVARRIELGRESELTSSLGDYVVEVPHAHAQRCILANILCRHGQGDRAAATLDDLREQSWAMDGWDRAIAFRHLGEVAVALQDVELAEALIEQVVAYSGQLLASFTGVTIEAAADRVRGQALLALDRTDEAIAAFEAAHRTETAFGAHALAARTAYWKARARLAAGGRSSRSEAGEIARAALDFAGGLGMDALADDLRALGVAAHR